MCVTRQQGSTSLQSAAGDSHMQEFFGNAHTTKLVVLGGTLAHIFSNLNLLRIVTSTEHEVCNGSHKKQYMQIYRMR